MENREEQIKASKIRCRRKGMDPDRRPCGRRLNESALQRRIADCHVLIRAAQPYLDLMAETFQICGSIVALADDRAQIILLAGPRTALEAAQKKGLALGVSLREEDVGTTAAALSLRHRVPFYVSGEDYYLNAFRDGSCFAAPVKENGRVIGLMIIVHPQRNGHPHTFTLAQTAAELVSRECRELTEGDLVRSLGESLTCALVVTGNRGEIKYANGPARRFLKIDGCGESVPFLDGVQHRTGEFSNEIIPACRVGRNFLVTRKKRHAGYLYLIEPVSEPREGASAAGKFSAPYKFDDIIGLSALKKKARQLAGQRVNVLVLGESGTGKELFASAIHNAEIHPAGRFVAVNCSAIPATLFETELFGHVRGAFTDARHDRPGKIEFAQRGTMFFDEIGDLPADVQGKLLRVLETRRVCPLGGNEEYEIDVRFVFATNRDLKDMVKKGRFREDLYYRISPVQVRIPALRERKEEIPELIDHFLEKVQVQYKKFISGITDEALGRLVEYDYPGNVRELEGIIRSAYLNCAADRIGPEDLELEPRSPRTLKERLDGFRRQIIMEKLSENAGDVRRTAEELKISRRSIYRYIKPEEAK
jgi:transcriptional regulator of acetoin/glycerol metabolism